MVTQLLSQYIATYLQPIEKIKRASEVVTNLGSPVVVKEGLEPSTPGL